MLGSTRLTGAFFIPSFAYVGQTTEHASHVGDAKLKRDRVVIAG